MSEANKHADSRLRVQPIVIQRDVSRFGDATENVSIAELHLMRRVVQSSADLVKARHWPEFADACGGLKKLERIHEAALMQYEAWHNEACG